MYDKIFFERERDNICLGRGRKKDNCKGKGKDIKDYLSNVIEEENMMKCLILFLKRTDCEFITYIYQNKNMDYSHFLNILHIFSFINNLWMSIKRNNIDNDITSFFSSFDLNILIKKPKISIISNSLFFLNELTDHSHD